MILLEVVEVVVIVGLGGERDDLPSALLLLLDLLGTELASPAAGSMGPGMSPFLAVSCVGS